MKTVELGNVMLLTLAVFIVVWGLVYGLWRDGWWVPAAVLAVAVIPRRNR